MGPKPQALQSSSESVSSEDAINNRKDKTYNPNLAHILFLTHSASSFDIYFFNVGFFPVKEFTYFSEDKRKPSPNTSRQELIH